VQPLNNSAINPEMMILPPLFIVLNLTEIKMGLF